MPGNDNNTGGATQRSAGSGAGGAIVLARGGGLSGGSTRKVREKVQIGNRTFRKREGVSPLEATRSTRIKAVEREYKLKADIRKLKAANTKLKGKENDAQRKANNAKIKKLEAQAKRWENVSNRLISRESELKNKGVSFAFSGAKSNKNVLGIQVNRNYSANRVLGLKPGSTVSDANRAYRKAAQKYHPDAPQNRSLSARDQQRNQRKFQMVTEAYQAYKEYAPRALGV